MEGAAWWGKDLETLKVFFPIYSLTCTIHFGLIFQMGDQLFEITQLGLNASKPNTSRGSSLPALLSSLPRKERFAAYRGNCKADLGALRRVI